MGLTGFVVRLECKIHNRDVSVLFVCMGNICRSPAGEAILREMVVEYPSLRIHVDSCGIGDWHIGRGADSRMRETAMQRGIALTGLAKQFQQENFDQFDYILVADKEVMKYLHHYARTADHKAKIFLMTAFSALYKDLEVPDPYYEPNRAFDFVLDMLEDSCCGLIEHIQKNDRPLA